MLKTLAQLRIKVPSQVRVVGLYDVRYATLLPVALTTIHQPYREIFQTAFPAMQERVKEPTIPSKSRIVAPPLVARDSCGAH